MDPVTVLSLVTAIGSVLKASYEYSSTFKDAPAEIARLRSELFGLKAAFEHIASNLSDDFSDLSLNEAGQSQTGKGSDDENVTTLKDASTSLYRNQSLQSIGSEQTLVASTIQAPASSSSRTSMLETEETLKTLEDARRLLYELDRAFGPPPASRTGRLIQRATWPFKKAETTQIADHLEKIKTYFVLATTSDSLNVCRQVYWEIRAMRRDAEDQTRQAELRALRGAVSKWLSPVEPFVFQSRLISNRQTGTGLWFLKHQFKDWTQNAGGSSVLWLRGKPGSGKSTLFSACVETLNNTQDHIKSPPPEQAFFYCSANEVGSQLPVNVLGSFVAQICNKRPEFWPVFEDYYQLMMQKSGSQQKTAVASDLEGMLTDVCQKLPRVAFLLDAPNESPEAQEILQSIFNVANAAGNVQLLVTSTEELDMSALSSFNLVNMDAESIRLDIGAYVETCLQTIPNLRRLPEKLRTDVKTELMKRSEGSFRWTACQLDYISRQRSAKDIRTALEQVPATLEETYVSILCSIAKEDRALAREFLKWLTFALAGLKLDQLTEAAVLLDEHPTLDAENRLLEVESLLAQLRSLVRYERASQTVGLAHESVRTFLSSPSITQTDAAFFHLRPLECESDVAAKCVRYLSLPALDGFCEHQELVDRCNAWPLLWYAASNWSLHLKYVMAVAGTALPSTVAVALTTFFASCDSGTNGGNYAAWYQLVFPDGNPFIWKTHPLYTACREGLLPVVKAILASEGTKNLERPGGRTGSTPLHVAAAYGHIRVVNELLKAGADPNERNAAFETGMFWASYYGYEDIVDAFLKAGGDPARKYSKLQFAILFLVGPTWTDEDCQHTKRRTLFCLIFTNGIER